MSTTIVMPKAGLTMVEGTISQWLVTEGAHVKKGDALMEYENEKNTIECDALADGYVHILAQEGDTIPVGEPIGILAESPEELAAMFRAQRDLGYKGGMLVTNPIPEEDAMDKAVIDAAIEQALKESVEQGVHGKETTPFLLARVVELTGGDSLESNIKLVLNNAAVAAQTACRLCK